MIRGKCNVEWLTFIAMYYLVTYLLTRYRTDNDIEIGKSDMEASLV